MMTYNKTATLNHPIAKSYPSCVKDLDMIILTNDNQLKTKPNYFLEVITIDLDAVQEEIAIRDKKDKDSSTDTFFIAIDTKKKSKCILVELKLNVENPYNYFNKNKNREDLRKKIIDSITLLGKTISIHKNTSLFLNCIIQKEVLFWILLKEYYSILLNKITKTILL